ncbi:MAG TPA: succinyldiaminopimelate transaminase [Chromatiales bacterium]|nr:succinyldiaminopimelate transaminase [Chromatiales bacterium]
MNPDLQRLNPYPFERLAQLRQGITPPPGLEPIALSIGEPKESTPGFIGEALLEHLHALASYPLTRGGEPLREAVAAWLTRRFALGEGALDPARHVLPVNGTREALFALAQTVIDRGTRPLVLLPNPFYQIYEGAALLAGAEPWYVPCRDTDGKPDFDAVPEPVWARSQLVYVCTPHNPTGAVLGEAELQALLDRAEEYDFVVASDECYSEIYPDEERPPPGILGAAWRSGRTDFRRALAFHSLSKRSNAPGLRSGFVAGDAEVLAAFLRYRTYHGCAMPLPTQAASRAAWSDEAHVAASRARYREKFRAVREILEPVLELNRPEGGFYYWPRTPVDDERFTRLLLEQANVTVLPGRYLSRTVAGRNPGERRIRMALVAPLDECVEAAWRIRKVVEGL